MEGIKKWRKTFIKCMLPTETRVGSGSREILGRRKLPWFAQLMEKAKVS
jgi:hypothetical protein